MSKRVDALVVDADGQLVMWHRGAVHGPKELVREIEFNAAVHTPVELIWGVAPVEASLEEGAAEIAIVAALSSATPGRATLVQGSPAVDAWYDSFPSEPGVIY